MMQIYRVSFFKRLTDSTGHPVDACQGTVEVNASGKDRAIKVARAKFAELGDVAIWSMRADYARAEALPGRKRPSSLAWRNSREENTTAH
jgi:hypothetical protein